MLAKSALISLVVLLVWGNSVAGLKVGLACPDWPLCHNEIIPPFRGDIYMEFLHRVIGAVAAALVIWLAARRFRSYKGKIKILPAAVIVLLLAQIVIGGLVVLLKLPTNLTTAHFANATFIFCAVIYFWRFEKNPENGLSLSGISGVWFVVAALVFFQGILGAFVRHSSAGLACGTDFPKCLGFWIPLELEGGILAHFLHRGMGYLTALAAIGITVFSYLGGEPGRKVRKSSYALLGAILAQIVIGLMLWSETV